MAGFACAGGFSAAVVAGPVATGTTATTTAPTVTTTTGTTTQPPPAPRATIAPGVTIGGVAVGGLDPVTAADAVREAFARPLTGLVGARRLSVTPGRLGARAYVQTAVARARVSAANTRVKLAVAVHGAPLRSYVAGLAKRFDRGAIDARLRLRGLAPFIVKERSGRRLDRPLALGALVRTLHANARRPVRLKLREIRPRVTRASFGEVIVIRRSSNRLFLYRGMRFWRVFGVATGQSAYPTPLGQFAVAVKWRNPWWYPPASDWAKDAEPIPPGPGNPLGTRWMGLTAPLVGIHGTPDAASIGYSASHGCIRMRISEAEWLFDHVSVGTPVYIVAA